MTVYKSATSIRVHLPQPGSKSVTLPETLLERIERLIDAHPELGFATYTEYIRHVVWSVLVEDEKRLPKK